jgi:hypothetical protein
VVCGTEDPRAVSWVSLGLDREKRANRQGIHAARREQSTAVATDRQKLSTLRYECIQHPVSATKARITFKPIRSRV